VLFSAVSGPTHRVSTFWPSIYTASSLVLLLARAGSQPRSSSFLREKRGGEAALPASLGACRCPLPSLRPSGTPSPHGPTLPKRIEKNSSKSRRRSFPNPNCGWGPPRPGPNRRSRSGHSRSRTATSQPAARQLSYMLAPPHDVRKDGSRRQSAAGHPTHRTDDAGGQARPLLPPTPR
jgi:hypothetical protein